LIPLIFIFQSNKIPDYIIPSIRFASENSGLDVILLVNKKIYTTLSEIQLRIKVEQIEDFYIRDEFVNSYNNRFQLDSDLYTFSMERFLILSEYTKKYGYDEFIHGEADNLFFDLTIFIRSIKLNGIKGIFAPRVNEKYVIASIFYCNDLRELDNLVKYILTTSSSKTEMEILSDYQYLVGTNFYTLPSSPTEPNSQLSVQSLEYNNESIITDANVIGHWLFGVDPKFKFGPVLNGYKNPLNKQFPIEDYSITLVLSPLQLLISDRYGKKFKVTNIHVHSKTHTKILNNNTFTTIINNLNNGKKTIIDFNFSSFISLKLAKRYLLLFRIRIIRLIFRK
jgi:hypothetical protein